MNVQNNRLKLAGIAGWPAHHSLSPVIHNYWINQLRNNNININAAYTMFAVRPDEAIRAFNSLKKTSINGLNITMPLKSLAYKAVDKHTEEAQKLGVCNVIYKKNKILIGHNTDMEGFIAPLINNITSHELLNMTITIIGTGGAARAALGALLTMGIQEIRLIGRDNEKSKKLVNHINTPNLQYWRWQDRNNAIKSSNLLVNATSAGFVSKKPLDINLDFMSPNTWVYDLVYNPLQTPLLNQAQKRGLNIIDGLDMLIAQARPSFKLFFEQDPPQDNNVKNLLLKHLDKA